MPYGCAPVADGMRFNLWAPAARTVALSLCNHQPVLLRAMQALADGWFTIVAPEAHPGTRYCFEIDGKVRVPDPASRWNPAGVHEPSAVVDPTAYEWHDDAWRGRPWHEAVIYELHGGTFSAAGTFEGVISRLDELVHLGVTAIELMPISTFAGARNWGYDGVLPFAPAACYGKPDDLKRLVDAAHARGLMMLLDVVYNHFGPEGNYLSATAPSFFTDRHETPWGKAIDFDGPASRGVRDFFIHNALYWLLEYRFDGLRLDAVHAIHDDSEPHVLLELAAAVRAGPGRDRQVHLILENDDNRSSLLGSAGGFDAQWNDDAHHCLHVLATGERDGYYVDYASRVHARLGRALASGFVYQGERSAHRDGRRRGEPSDHLPATAFINFLQNHDQIGNRAFGERLCQIAEPHRLRALTEILLLAPSIPLLFMGEEWGASTPFPFFCDFSGPLREAVTNGRRAEFKRFRQFARASSRARIPDPCEPATFAAAKLDWSERARSPHAQWLALHQTLLAIRHRELIPRLATIAPGGLYESVGRGVSRVRWAFGDRTHWVLEVNLTDRPAKLESIEARRLVYASNNAGAESARLPPWSVRWFVSAR